MFMNHGRVKLEVQQSPLRVKIIGILHCTIINWKLIIVDNHI